MKKPPFIAESYSHQFRRLAGGMSETVVFGYSRCHMLCQLRRRHLQVVEQKGNKQQSGVGPRL